jgi:hypothetical protein
MDGNFFINSVLSAETGDEMCLTYIVTDFAATVDSRSLCQTSNTPSFSVITDNAYLKVPAFLPSIPR